MTKLTHHENMISFSLGDRFLQILLKRGNKEDLLNRLTHTEWENLFQFVHYHQISPILILALQNESIPYPFSQTLKSIGLQLAVTNLRFIHELEILKEVFQSLHVNPILFKGPLLAKKLWGELSYRECIDLDLLIPLDQQESCWKVLQELGYQWLKPHFLQHRRLWWNAHYQVTFYHPLREITLELHWNLMPSFLPLSLPKTDFLWDSEYSYPLPEYQGVYYSFQSLFYLIFLCLHAFRHSWSKLNWILDAYQLWKLEQFSGTTLQDYATRYRIQKIMQRSLALFDCLTQYSVGHNYLWKKDCSIYPIYVRWCSIQPPLFSSSLECYRTLARDLDSWKQKLTFWSRLLFQPTSSDWLWWNLPESYSWFYPVIRPFRLLTTKLLKSKLRGSL